LAEPEHGLFADGGIAVGLGDVDELGDALVFGHLTEGEDGFLFHFGVGIVFDGVGDGGGGLLAGFLSDPEESLSANVRAFVVVGHANHFVDGAGFAADGESEGDLGTDFAAGIGLRHFLQREEAGFAAGFAEPEGGLLAELFGGVGADERFESGFGGIVGVECNGAESLMAVAIVVVAEVIALIADEGGEKRDALGGLYVGAPDEWEATCVERAFGGCDADFCDLVIFGAEEDGDFARAFEHDGGVAVVAGDVDAVIALLEAAGAAVVAVPVAVAAADAAIAGDFRDGVAEPLWSCNLGGPGFELGVERTGSGLLV